MGKASTMRRLDAARATYGSAARRRFSGKGDAGARVMFVGEQPGNDEDLAGHPFVGPAGRLLDEALEEAGIDRAQSYVTNVVKHFKWEPRGKRRIHAKPNCGGDRGVRALARGGAGGGETARIGLPRRDSRAGAARAAVPRHRRSAASGSNRRSLRT